MYVCAGTVGNAASVLILDREQRSYTSHCIPVGTSVDFALTLPFIMHNKERKILSAMHFMSAQQNC